MPFFGREAMRNFETRKRRALRLKLLRESYRAKEFAKDPVGVATDTMCSDE